MSDTLTLSRYRLETFLACQRRFQLRFLRRLPWPDAPPDDTAVSYQTRGQQFHQLLERHFLGLPISADALADPMVKSWWSAFRLSDLTIPEGERHPERSLTIPVGRHLLTGRFDLLVVEETAVHLFDWKTGRARDEAELRRDWQTRLYLALVAEAGDALGRPIDPDQITLIYWYVTEPEAARIVRYSGRWHGQNWAEIKAVIAQIDAQLSAQPADQSIWPLTDDWSLCRRCDYQVYCGRQAAGEPVIVAEEEATEEAILSQEPELP